MKGVMQYVLSLSISYHWWLILRYRKRGEKLIADGEPLTSERLIYLAERIDHHGLRVFALEHRVESIILSGLKDS